MLPHVRPPAPAPRVRRLETTEPPGVTGKVRLRCDGTGNDARALGSPRRVRLDHGSPLIPSKGVLAGPPRAVPCGIIRGDPHPESRLEKDTPPQRGAEERQRLQPGRGACARGHPEDSGIWGRSQPPRGHAGEAAQGAHTSPPCLSRDVPGPQPWGSAWLPRNSTLLGHFCVSVSVAWGRLHLKQTLSGTFWK